MGNSIFAVLVPFFFFSHTAFAWNLNDVSILYKLPNNSTEYDQMIKANDQHSKSGTLLPKYLLDRIGGINNASTQSEKIYQNLRAISLRFDPCPPLKSIKEECMPELRLIWQPVFFNSQNSKFESEDAALHTFYRLNSSQYSRVKSGLLKLKLDMERLGVSTENLPLGIHPALLKPKTYNDMMNGIQLILTDTVGEKNLYKVTAMKLLVPENWWKFLSAFEKDAKDNWIPAQIARHGGDQIDILNEAVITNPNTHEVDESDTSIFTMTSPIPEKDDLRFIVSSGFRKTFLSSNPDRSDLEQFKVGLGAVNRLQNPKITNAHTVDCAHCHFSNAAEVFALKVFPELKPFFLNDSDHFKNPNPTKYNLSNQTVNKKSTKAVRAFGYLGTEPSILDRTIFESASIADWLNNIN